MRLLWVANIFYLEEREYPDSPELTLPKVERVLTQYDNGRLLPVLNIFKTLFEYQNLELARKRMNEFMDWVRSQQSLFFLVDALNQFSQIEEMHGNQKIALRHLFHALELARDTLHNKQAESVVLNQLGIFYMNHNDTTTALTYYKQSLNQSSELTNMEIVASASNNIAMIYQRMAQYDSAVFYYHRAIDLFTISEVNFQIGRPMINMAETFRQLHQFDSALYWAKKGNETMRQRGDIIPDGFFTLAKTFRDMGIKDNTLIYLDSSRHIYEKGGTLASREFYFGAGKIYYEYKMYREAAEYFQKGIVVSDSFFSLEKAKAMKEYEAKYESGKKEKEIEKQQEQIKQQRIINYSVISVSVLLLVLVLFIVRSVLLQRKANAELQKAKERAEQSEKFKEQFLANMSHELRTPMNAVLGMTNLVLDTPLTEKQKNYLTKVKKSSENLLVILNDILDLSKMEAGKMELVKEPFLLREQVEHVMEILRFKAQEKGLKFETEIAEDVPKVVIGDAPRLNQILINILGNAIKFTDKGSVGLQVSKTDAIQFSVTDTGIGMSEEQLKKIFGSFVQAETTTSRKYGGTGLGLAISKTLVELHGGKIDVRSETGKGSEFRFEIPYEAGDEKDIAVQVQQKQTDYSSLSKMKILVAEDNEFNQIVIKDTLENLLPGIQVEIAENGKIAVEKAGANTYDVVLMDVNMPEMDGYDATRAIRKTQSTIPIIALTASVIRSDLDKCTAAGMNGYVPKPFKREELLNELTKWNKS